MRPRLAFAGCRRADNPAGERYWALWYRALVGARFAKVGAHRHGAIGVAPIVLGHVANHRTTTRAGVTLAVYQQYQYDKEKRAALDLWAERLAAIIDGKSANVVALHGAAS
jgi:hypothetical protein